LIRTITLCFFIILFLSSCSGGKANYISNLAKNLIDSGVAPKGKKLIIFSGDNVNYYLVRKLSDDKIKEKRKKMESLLGNQTAKTADLDGVCTIIVNPDKAFAKYHRKNIDILLAHEIGHCYGDLLNIVCSAGDCLNPSESYIQYIQESFADFIGMYKLAEKSGRIDSFNEKISINKNWKGTDYNYEKNNKSVILAQSLYNKGKNHTDLALARLFISRVCSRAEISSDECITSATSKNE
jgi:hypothetical protein